MKKRINNAITIRSFITGLVLTFGCYTLSGFAVEAAAADDDGALERAIEFLVDPFVSKLKPLPLPPPPPPPPVKIVPPAPVIPVPVPVIVKPPPVVLPALNLSGIVFSTTRPMAIINGEVFEPGQVISSPKGDVKITRINKNNIQLFYLSTSFTIAIDQGE